MIIKTLQVGDIYSHPDMDLFLAREAPAPAVVADLSDDEAGMVCSNPEKDADFCKSPIQKIVVKNGTWIIHDNSAFSFLCVAKYRLG